MPSEPRAFGPPYGPIGVALMALILLVSTLWVLKREYHLHEFLGHTTAQITGTNCWNHGEASYSYVVGGRRYSDHDSILECARTKVGAPVPIWFDTTDPRITTSNDPEQSLSSQTTGSIVLAIVFLLAFIWAVRGTLMYLRETRA